jgi:hypothetical protein
MPHCSDSFGKEGFSMLNLQDLLNPNFLIIDETYNQSKLRQMVTQNTQEFIILVDQDGVPTRITTRESYLAQPRSATEDIKRVTVTWAACYLANVSTPLPLLTTFLPKVEQTASPGVIILREKQIIGILVKKSLFSILSQVQEAANLQPVRYPDVYGVLAAANIPDPVCYRCTRCDYQVQVSMQADVPICKTKSWHGKLMLINCPSPSL